MTDRCVWAFGAFSLDADRRTLRRGDAVVDLGDRAFSVLVLLVSSAGEVVDKRTLLDLAWPDVTVGDNTLVQAVREIRAALGDDPSNPRCVQTVHRRGYRFVSPVERLEAEVMATAPTTAEPVPVRVSWLPRVVLAGAILAVGVATVTLLVPGDPGPPPFVAARLRALHDLPDGAMKPAYSPIGDLLVAVVADPVTDVHSLWLVKPGAEAPLRLTSGIEVQGPSPVFNADGSAVLFTSYRNDPERGMVPDVWEVPVLGGEPRRLVEGASGASQSPEGSSLAYAKVTAGGTTIAVRRPDGGEEEIAERGFWPRWSPDGRWIAFTTSNPEGSDGDVFVTRPDGRDRRQLSTRASQVYGLCWTPDSEWVIFGCDVEGVSNLWVAAVDGGEPTRITRGPGESDSPSVSSDGQRLVFSYGLSKSAVHVASAPGRPLTRIMSQEQATPWLSLRTDDGSR